MSGHINFHNYNGKLKEKRVFLMLSMCNNSKSKASKCIWNLVPPLSLYRATPELV